jgi:signal transduction histidine kinase
MSNLGPRSRLLQDARLFPIIGIMPYVLLGILAVVTVVAKHASIPSLLIDLALCVAIALWMWWMFTAHPAWRDRPLVMGIFVAVLVGLTFVLVLRDVWFGFFAIADYVFAFALLRWPWRLLGVAATAIVAGTAQASGVPKDTLAGVAIYIAVVAANVVVMCGLCWILWNGDDLSAQRATALDEAREANRKLQETLKENATLNARLIAQAREAGVNEERQRMAREIHDTLAQGLIGIIMQLQAADQASRKPAEWRRHFELATSLARESLTEARRSVDALRPEPLEAGRLVDAVVSVAERWSKLQDIPVQVSTSGDVRILPPEAEVALLRTAQEALANVARHAKASTVDLLLSYEDCEVSLEVRDDGAGFETPKTSARTRRTTDAGGFGLVAMRQRIEGLSGTLKVESVPGSGTAVSASLPAEAQDAA